MADAAEETRAKRTRRPPAAYTPPVAGSKYKIKKRTGGAVAAQQPPKKKKATKRAAAAVQQQPEAAAEQAAEPHVNPPAALATISLCPGTSVECVTSFSRGTLIGRWDARTLLYNIKEQRRPICAVNVTCQ